MIFLIYLLITSVAGDIYQLSSIKDDNSTCVGEVIAQPSSLTECVLRCSRKKQVAIYKEGKRCFCIGNECFHQNITTFDKEEIGKQTSVGMQKIQGRYVRQQSL